MNILVLDPCSNGDVLMATPLVASIRAAHPQARIDFAAGAQGRAAILTNPDVDEVLPLYDTGSSRWRRLVGAVRAAARLRLRRYDVAFVPDRSILAQLVAYFAGIPRRYGVARLPRAMLLTDAVADTGDLHDVDLWLRLGQRAGMRRVIKREMKYIPTQVALERALHTLRDAQFDRLPFRVALCPGGLGAPRELAQQRWPGERFALLANRLGERYGAGVILLGEESDRETNFAIRNDIGYPVLDLTGSLDFDGMGAVMQLCEAMIGNDSEPLHLAVAVGTPSIGVFGPTSARQRGPYGARHRAVQAHIYCGPCARIGGPMQGCGAACMQRVTVQDLVSALEFRAAATG